MKYRAWRCQFLVMFGLVFMPMMAFASDSITDGQESTVKLSQSESSVVLMPSRQGELNGYKGYRYRRPGYKKHIDGWWYPEAAFLPGAANPHNIVKLQKPKAKMGDSFSVKIPQAHIDSCKARYRSYDVNDNTYQPLQGSRKPCKSRYLKVEP